MSASAANGRRLPNAAHEPHPWVISEMARDFHLLDVWALPTPGAANEFPRLVRLLSDLDPARIPSSLTRALFAVRTKLGDIFGWDEPAPEAERQTLRDRVPEDLQQGAATAAPDPFETLYETDNEWAIETANRTVHGILHLAWVPDDEVAGRYRGQMAILVKPNGVLGRAYLALISPFRHVIVYPALGRHLARQWREQQPAASTSRHA